MAASQPVRLLEEPGLPLISAGRSIDAPSSLTRPGPGQLAFWPDSDLFTVAMHHARRRGRVVFLVAGSGGYAGTMPYAL